MGSSLSLDIDIEGMLSEIEEGQDLIHASSDRNILGVYSEQDLRKYARASGLMGKMLDQLGLKDESELVFLMDTSDNFVHGVTVTSRALLERTNAGGAEKDSFYLRVYVRRKLVSIQEMAMFQFKGNNQVVWPQWFGRSAEDLQNIAEYCSWAMEFFGGPKKELPLSVIEYLYLQNPHAQFSAKRPALPAQQHPGLGVAKETFKMIVAAAAEHKRSAILNYPENFHNALITEQSTSQWSRMQGMLFFDPRIEGCFQSIAAALRPEIKRKGLAAVSFAVHYGNLRVNGEKFFWTKVDQLFPLSSKFQKYFKSKQYLDAVRRYTVLGADIKIDWEG